MAARWTNGAVVTLTVVVGGCASEPCYLNSAIDWRDDGDFGPDIQDLVFSNQPVYNGSNVLTLTVPDGTVYTVGTDIYARFRLCSATSGASSCMTGGTETMGGEVEDYFWVFNTNAVVVSDLDARSTSSRWAALAAGAISLVGVGGALLLLRRKRTM